MEINAKKVGNTPTFFVVKMMFQKTINRLTVFVKGRYNSPLTSKIKNYFKIISVQKNYNT